MPEDAEPNGAEVSDAMSEGENEYDDPVKEDDEERMGDNNTSPEPGNEATEVKKKYDPKDPHRPRRKKARRACFACQRAHLTCGMSFEALAFPPPYLVECFLYPPMSRFSC